MYLKPTVLKMYCEQNANIFISCASDDFRVSRACLKTLPIIRTLCYIVCKPCFYIKHQSNLGRIYMKIKNNPHQRQENIIKYLNQHDEVTTNDIREAFHIAKSTLSEDIKYLRSKGYPIMSRYGYISLEKGSNTAPISYYEKLSPEVIRKWVICFAAANMYNPYTRNNEMHSLADLENLCKRFYELLSPETTAMSTHVFRKDIISLISEGYLEYSKETIDKLANKDFLRKNRKDIVPTSKVSILSIIKPNDINEFLESLNDITKPIPIAGLIQHLKLLCPAFNNSQISLDESLYKTIPNLVSHFYKTNFKSKSLDITCLNVEDNCNPISYNAFETGSILYSAEKRNYYLLGMAFLDKSTDKGYHLIPIDYITHIKETTVENSIFNSVEIQNACSHIICASLDDNTIKPTEITLWIIGTPENKAILEQIKKSRKNARVETVDNVGKNCSLNPDKVKTHGVIEYTDTIIGKADLLPFILGFGNQIQIISPNDVVQMVTHERQCSKTRYEKAFKSEYKENIHECL